MRRLEISDSISWLTLVLTVFSISVLFTQLSGFMLIASFNFFILLVGYLLRRVHKVVHALLMSMGIVSDITIVVILQVQREAIQTVASMTLPFLNLSHVLFSTLATMLYFPILILGILLLICANGKNRLHLRNWHICLGTMALIFRTLGFFLMFSMISS